MFLSSVFDIPVTVAASVVSVLATVLAPLFAGASTAAAIVCFTVAVRVLLLPLSYAQIRGERTRATLQPKIQQLRERHRDNPQRLQREMSALYSEQGGALFAGCLPTLAQIPFFIVMYRLFAFAGEGRGDLLRHELLGVPLSDTWFATVAAAGPLGAPGLVFLGLFGLLVLVAWWSAKRMRAVDMPAPAASVLRLLPFGTVVVAAVVPLAAGLYLLVSTAWTTTERAVLGRRVNPSRE